MATSPKPEGDVQVAVAPGQDNDNKDKKAMSTDMKTFNIIFGVTQAVGLLLVVLMLVWTSNHAGGFAWRSQPAFQFNWHPLLMTVGLIYLFANSIMIYRALQAMRKQKLKLIHASIHGIVVLCIVIAQIAVFDFHNNNNPPIPNLYSLHSWIGLLAIIIYVAQFVGSILIFLYPGAALSVRGTVMPWHIFLGLFAFILSLAAAVSGLLEKAIFKLKEDYGKLEGEAVLMNSMGLLFILFGVLVVYLVTEPKYKRHPRPEDGALLNTSPAM